jgi:hypothetical protein
MVTKWWRNFSVVLAAGTVVGVAGVIGYTTLTHQGTSFIPTVKSAIVSDVPLNVVAPPTTTQRTLTPVALAS